ncbi:hypothetical protein M8C21_009223 [Ambrosia artemisiifolia]|uniref:Uncharacterized protein n=1 Tax=Ambrosia artemisiifolia TaxID=4212 RepID=A0AAD5D297_AMBAR|nr:hypothetical protein M8C21_009223 [Ambrosia artemisiifolia]
MKKGVTIGEPTFRVTRARLAASQSSSSELAKGQGTGRVLNNNSKRSVQDENRNGATATGGAQNKRRAVLKDVTNMCCDNSYKNCIVPAKISKKNGMVTKKNPVKILQVSANTKSMKCDETERAHIQSTVQKVRDTSESEAKKTVSQLQNLSKKGKSKINEKLTVSSHPDFIDIDSDKRDPQMCSLYVCEIYSNLRVAELIHRPRSDFMKTVQRDVTPSMRGVLVDWLVEVSVEYKLEPDTLHRTVRLIDSFLSKNYIERQKLQLLGITYSTYTKSEVLEMESQVLNILNFHLSPPTAQTFVRRFIRAAQASHQSPSLELEYLASYLAELTLIDYNFLVFLPSNIAAAAVFLARWMLDQSGHPWNHTLEYYTNYKPLDLKNTVFALHGLHLSDRSSPLTVIRSKYKQDKFNSVASLPSRELPETLF